MKKLLSWAGIIAFFIGMPLAGSVYFWKDAHRKIRERALSYVKESALPLLKTWDSDKIFDQWSIEGRKRYAAPQIAAWKDKLGALESSDPCVAVRSYAGERDDNVWQFTDVECYARFEKGPARVRVLVTHKTTSSTWQIEDLDIQ